MEIFSTEVFYSDLGILGAFWRLDFWRMCGKNFHNLSIGVPRFCGKNFHILPIGVKSVKNKGTPDLKALFHVGLRETISGRQSSVITR